MLIGKKSCVDAEILSILKRRCVISFEARKDEWLENVKCKSIVQSIAQIVEYLLPKGYISYFRCPNNDFESKCVGMTCHPER
jgi:hypothetical protein